MAKKIILAGGGTGGHIFPAIAIANALKKQRTDIDILFVGARGKMEMEKVPQAGYAIKALDIEGFNRSSLIKNIGLPLKLLRSFFQVRRILKDFKPDAVIGVGGYSSFPVLRYAQLKAIPTFIHESNSFAGKSNILLGKMAKRIFVASEGMDKFFPQANIVITGNPIRPSIANVSFLSKHEALAFFGLKEGKITILAVGGSLGAKSINEALAEHIGEFRRQDLQLIWQTGRSEAARWKALACEQPNVSVSEFIMQMEYGYAAADIVISRAGAMAVAELCVVKKPVVFVPYPFAAEDHQTANAVNLVKDGAACMVKDIEAGNKIVPMVMELVSNPAKRAQMERSMGKHAVVNADERIAKEILECIN